MSESKEDLKNMEVIKKEGTEPKSEKPMSALESKFQAITDGISSFFYEVGVYVNDNPRNVMYISIAFTLLCGCGFARFETESRAEKLFTPQDSQAILDQEWVSETFPSAQRYITLMASDSNLIDSGRDPIYDLFSIYEAFDDGAIGEEGDKLKDICIKNAAGGCSVTGPLAFWNYDRDTFTNDINWVTTMSDKDATDCCSSRPNADIKPDEIMGGIERNSAGVITKVAVYRMQWLIEETTEVVDNRTRDPRADSLELEFAAYVDDDFKPAGKEELVQSSRAANSETISGTFAFDGILTFVSYVLITCFATWILSDSANPVRSRSNLGPFTVLVVVMSVVASFGIVIACGVAFNPVVNSVIFVLLGVGVDDALVILEHMDKEYKAGTKPNLRIPRALSKAGASISLTSFTDFAAFLAGSTTIIPALRYFCIFAAVAIFVDYCMQLTTFIVFLKWDENRIQEGRPTCGCCRVCSCAHPGQVVTQKASMDNSMDKVVDENVGDVEMTTTSAVATTDAETGGSGVDAAVGEDEVSPFENSSYEKDTYARRFITKQLPDLILSPMGKVGVLLATIAIFIVAGFGIVELQLDFQSVWFIPSGTDAKVAAELSAEYFTGENIPVFMYTKNVDYYTYAADVISLCDDLAEDKYVVDTSVSCWMKEWKKTDANALSKSDAATFYTSLNTYLQGSGAQYKNFIKWNDDTDPTKGIYATKIFGLYEAAKNANENIDSMLSVRKVQDKYPQLDAMAFTTPYVFWEGLRVVYEETVRNVIVTVIVVYFVCMIFLGDIWAATLTTLSVCFVDICLFGFLHWIGLHMNTVTCINLLLALGLTVDYSAHLAHAYMHVGGATKDERVRKAYDKIGVSIFNGGMTTFVAILALAGARTYVFDSFFRCFVLIISFGLYFGLIVLPVMLSVIGPDKVFRDEEVLALKFNPAKSDDDDTLRVATEM